MHTNYTLLTPIAGTAAAQGYFRSVAAQGGGKLGTQAMARVLEQLGGFRFSKTDEASSGSDHA